MSRRKRQSEKGPVNAIDLGKKAGLTLMTESTASNVSDWLPTMIPQLDYILGGGIPFGRVTEIYGKEQSGKSTLAVLLTKIAQQMGVTVVWADVEGTASQENLEQLGADPHNLFLIQPKEGEVMTIEMVTERVKEVVLAFGAEDVPVMIIWDSLASTASERALKNPNQLGTTAASITSMTEQIGQTINQNNTAFIILNQARDVMGSMYPQIKSSGGRALEHWGSLRLEVAKASQLKEKVIDPVTLKESEEYVGHIFRVKTKKSKVSTPNRQAEMYLISMPFKGFDFAENVYRASVDQYGFISKGAWRKYTTDAGEEVNLRHTEWVPFLESDEGRPVLQELYRKMHLQMFPEGFAPLDNENIDVTVNPFYAEMDDYYEELHKVKKEEVTKETK